MTQWGETRAKQVTHKSPTAKQRRAVRKAGKKGFSRVGFSIDDDAPHFETEHQILSTLEAPPACGSTSAVYPSFASISVLTCDDMLILLGSRPLYT